MDDLFWRDEILQVMYWLRGEKLGESVAAADLLPFLSCSEDELHVHLGRAVSDGLLELIPDSANLRSGHRYRLTPFGKKEGGRSFAEEFDGLTKPAHADCPPN